ncbi:MAG: hypothetical protein ACR2PX_22380 [Endozoicomonas sp.]|uniref:hypothetical protein n=1 Tax=Endozoicomonas sp. TaxID=1892382 RepID=UPI003D9ACE8F
MQKSCLILQYEHLASFKSESPDQTTSLELLYQIPVRATASMLQVSFPLWYAAFAGSIARQFPALQPMLQSSLTPIVQLHRGWMYSTMMEGVMETGLLKAPQEYLTRQLRPEIQLPIKGQYPVFLEDSWLARHFKMTVTTHYFQKPALKIERLSVTTSPVNHVWSDLYQTLERHQIISLSITMDHDDPYEPKLNVLLDHQKVADSLTIPVRTEQSYCWVMAVLNDDCQQSNAAYYSLFQPEVLNILHQHLHCHLEQQDALKPCLLAIAPGAIRPSTSTGSGYHQVLDLRQHSSAHWLTWARTRQPSDWAGILLLATADNEPSYLYQLAQSDDVEQQFQIISSQRYIGSTHINQLLNGIQLAANTMAYTHFESWISGIASNRHSYSGRVAELFV